MNRTSTQPGLRGAASMLTAFNNRHRKLALASLTAVIAVVTSSTVAAQPQEEEKEKVVKRVRVNHPAVVVTVMLGSLGSFNETPIFDVLFRSSESGAETTPVVTAGGEPGKPTPTENLK